MAPIRDHVRRRFIEGQPAALASPRSGSADGAALDDDGEEGQRAFFDDDAATALACRRGVVHDRQLYARIVRRQDGVGIVAIERRSVGLAYEREIRVDRELADASAVQFTRNPGGIGGALQKIGGLSFGSRVEHTNAAQASHMFFSQSFVSRLFATHPPLSVRILRIDPGWDGKYPHVAPTHTDAREPGRPPPLRASHQERRQLNAQMLEGQAVGAATALALIGQTSQEHLQHAQSLVASIPDAVMHAAHEPFGARAVVYALLMDQDGQVRKAQWARLDAHADEQVLKLTRQLIDDVAQLGAEVRLPLLDMTIPALRQLAAAQYASFKVNVQELMHADDRVTLFEWMLRRMILAHLEPRFRKIAQRRPHIATLAGVKRECRVLLSGLAYAGHREEADAEAAYASARGALQITDVLLPRAECGLAQIDQALDELAGLAPRLRKQVIYACTTCITDDEQITVTEGELLRAVADALGCPMPPLLPGQALT